MSIAEYAALRRADGLPVDAWLRTHVRAGGTIVGVSPRAMMMAGSVAEWREWTACVRHHWASDRPRGAGPGPLRPGPGLRRLL